MQLIAVPILLLGLNRASACWRGYGYGYGGYGHSSYRPAYRSASYVRPTYAYAGWVGVAGVASMGMAPAVAARL